MFRMIRSNISEIADKLNELEETVQRNDEFAYVVVEAMTGPDYKGEVAVLVRVDSLKGVVRASEEVGE